MKEAEWILYSDWDDSWWYLCSNCEESFLIEMKNDGRYKYCPNCGCSMKFLEDD